MQVYVSLIYQTTSNGSVLLNIDILYIFWRYSEMMILCRRIYAINYKFHSQKL